MHEIRLSSAHERSSARVLGRLGTRRCGFPLRPRAVGRLKPYLPIGQKSEECDNRIWRGPGRSKC
eukprot:144511-Prymnesium_polylepis.1